MKGEVMRESLIKNYICQSLSRMCELNVIMLTLPAGVAPRTIHHIIAAH